MAGRRACACEGRMGEQKKAADALMMKNKIMIMNKKKIFLG
jgi:hypothetical protein